MQAKEHGLDPKSNEQNLNGHSEMMSYFSKNRAKAASYLERMLKSYQYILMGMSQNVTFEESVNAFKSTGCFPGERTLEDMKFIYHVVTNNCEEGGANA